MMQDRPSTRLRLRRGMAICSLVPILVAFIFSGGSGHRYSRLDSLSFSQDGKRLAVVMLNARDASVRLESSSADVARTISVFSVADGSLQRVVQQTVLYGNQGPAIDLSWNNGTSARFIGDDELYVLDFPAGDLGIFDLRMLPEAPAKKVSLPLPASALVDSPSRRIIAFCGKDQIAILDTLNESWEELEITGHLPLHSSMHFCWKPDSRTGSYLIYDSSLKLCIWTLNGETSHVTLSPKPPYSNCLAALSDSSVLVAVDGEIQRFSGQGESFEALEVPQAYSRVAASHDGTLYAYGNDAQLTIRETVGDRVRIIPHEGISAIAFSPDASTLAVGDHRDYMTLYDISSREQIWSVRAPGYYRLPWTYPLVALLIWFVLFGHTIWRWMDIRINPAPPERPSFG